MGDLTRFHSLFSRFIYTIEFASTPSNPNPSYSEMISHTAAPFLLAVTQMKRNENLQHIYVYTIRICSLFGANFHRNVYVSRTGRKVSPLPFSILMKKLFDPNNDLIWTESVGINEIIPLINMLVNSMMETMLRDQLSLCRAQSKQHFHRNCETIIVTGRFPRSGAQLLGKIEIMRYVD